MRVLHLHISDDTQLAGGIIAAHRLHDGLKRAGVDSKFLVRQKVSNSKDVIEMPRLTKIEKGLGIITSRMGLNDIHIINSFKIPRYECYASTDILHIQGTHSGCCSYLAFPSLSRYKPTVFTLHDMWSFTGHCSTSLDCERWKHGCGRCPYPGTHPPIRRDGTRIEWKLKQWAYRRSNLVIITPSTWLTALAKESLLGRFPIYHIPHGIDIDTYKPLGREQCRELLGIPKAKKVLLFASVDLNDYKKGGDLLVKALNGLPDSLRSDTLLLMLGTRGAEIAKAVRLETCDLGFITNDGLKAIAYTAADLCVVPSRAEAFGLIYLESMACGTPTVAFKIGGAIDLVRPGETGYLARPGDEKDFSRGIVELLQADAKRHHMGKVCREVALAEYTLEKQGDRHIRLYKELLEGRRPS